MIPKIYDIKLKSIEIYNNIQSLNYKIFNKLEYKEYKSSFISMKKELENKFTDLENKKLINERMQLEKYSFFFLLIFIIYIFII